MNDNELVRLIEGIPDHTPRRHLRRANAIRDWLKKSGSEKDLTQARYEYFALSVIGKKWPNANEGDWPGYFQPFIQMGGSENPGYNLVDKLAVPYWCKRMKETSQASLRARYADLIIDQAVRLTGTGAHNDVRQVYIEAVLQLAEVATSEDWYETQQLLARALHHARALRDSEIFKRLGQAVLNVDRIPNGEASYLPRHSLEILRHKHVPIEPADKERVINVFEAALEHPRGSRLCDFAKAHEALRCLLHHYKSDKDRTKRLELVGRIENFTEHCEDRDSGMRADWQWQFVQDAYSSEGHTDGVNRALAHRNRIASRAAAELKPLRLEGTIDRELVEQWLNQMCLGEPCEVLASFCDFHAPPKGGYTDFKAITNAENSILDFATEVQMDGLGRPITRTLASELDDESREIRRLREFIQMNSLLFILHVDRLKSYDWLDAQLVCNFIFGTGLIERDELLIEAVQFYFQKVHSAFLHVAIPRIERLIRCEAERLGTPTTRPNKTGGIDHRLLNELLMERALESTFDSLFLLYLRTLLTEKLGLNLRNDLLHGITSSQASSDSPAQISDRVFHALCAVAFFIQVAGSAASEEKPAEPAS